MNRTFTYRNGCVLFVALLFGGAGLVFALMALNGMLTGHPVPMTVNDVAVSPNSFVGWMPVLMPAIASLLGIWLLLFALNSRLVLTDDGITAYNWARRQIFKAEWSEIQSVYRAYDVKQGYNLAIQTANHTEMVTNSLVGFRELESILMERVGNVFITKHATG